MSDANLTKLLFSQEDEFAVLPVSPPDMQELRFLSSGLTHEKLTVMSEEIRSDRSRSKLIQVGKNATGPVETEFIVGAYNEFILAAMLAANWVTGIDTVTATATEVGDTIVLTASVGTFSTAAQKAKFVKITFGAFSATYHAIVRVISMGNTTLTFPKPAGVIGLFAGTVGTVEFNYIRNGVTLRSFLIEQQYLGMEADTFIQLVGMVVNQWTVGMEAQARVMQTFDFMGAKAYVDDATAGDGSPLVPSTRTICNTTSNIGSLIWNDALYTDNVMSFDLTLNNNLRNRPAISREITLEHGKGLCEPDGNLNVYFESKDQLEDFINHVTASLLLPIIDPDGNLLSIHMPQLEFPSGFPSIEGINTDTMMNLAFNATHSPGEGYTIQVDQLDAPTGS